jgi:undecaprenyl-diphosphatase
MDLLNIIILGIVEGATEFLPISSTAHILITEKLMNIKMGELFDIAIQMGAILAVIAYAPKRLFTGRKTQIAIITAFIPTAIIGFIVKDYVSILHDFMWVSILALFLGGILMLILEKKWTPKETLVVDNMSSKKAVVIGAIQTLAFIPGVSRSASTIYAGLSQGLTKKEAVAFSFFLGIPTMAAATFLSFLKVRNDLNIEMLTPIIIGTVVSFLVAYLVIKGFISYIEKHGFIVFAWYRIILAGILTYMFLF